MGFINFSLSYVISARDKRFYRVPLGDVLQEQFPEHGHVFVCYTFLILIGLYSCGMSFHNIAFACLCGAIFSLAYTGFMALLFTFGQTSKQKMVEYYLVGSRVPQSGEIQQIEECTAVGRLLSASDYINVYYKTNGVIPQTVAGRLWERLFDVQEQIAAAETENRPENKNGPAEQLDDIVTFTQLVACAALAWQHILWKLPPDQQSELICLTLQAYLKDSGAELLEDWEKFLDGKEYGRASVRPHFLSARQGRDGNPDAVLARLQCLPANRLSGPADLFPHRRPIRLGGRSGHRAQDAVPVVGDRAANGNIGPGKRVH